MLGADTPGRLRKNQVLDDMQVKLLAAAQTSPRRVELTYMHIACQQGAVDRLGVMASRIGTEVKDHQQLISGLGAEVEQGSEVRNHDMSPHGREHTFVHARAATLLRRDPCTICRILAL